MCVCVCFIFNVYKNVLSNLTGWDEASRTKIQPHGCGEVLTQQRVCSGFSPKKILDYRTSHATITAVAVDTNHEGWEEQPWCTASTGRSTRKCHLTGSWFTHEQDFAATPHSPAHASRTLALACLEMITAVPLPIEMVDSVNMKPQFKSVKPVSNQDGSWMPGTASHH